MVLVTEVPMLAPIIMGTACSALMTGERKSKLKDEFHFTMFVNYNFTNASHGNDDGGERGTTLHQDSSQDANHESHNGIGQKATFFTRAQNVSCSFSA